MESWVERDPDYIQALAVKLIEDMQQAPAGYGGTPTTYEAWLGHEQLPMVSMAGDVNMARSAVRGNFGTGPAADPGAAGWNIVGLDQFDLLHEHVAQPLLWLASVTGFVSAGVRGAPPLIVYPATTPPFWIDHAALASGRYGTGLSVYPRPVVEKALEDAAFRSALANGVVFIASGPPGSWRLYG
jgi:hypothetical protein